MDFLNVFFENLTIAANSMPLEVFTLFFSLLADISPIPTSVILGTAGTLAKAQDYLIYQVVLLALLAAIGETLAGLLWYVLAGKVQRVIFSKGRTIAGWNQEKVEKLSNRFNNSWFDDFILVALRALPLPNAPISVACGVVNLNVRTYIVSSLIGNLIRDFFYLYIGFSNAQMVNEIFSKAREGSFLMLTGVVTIIVFIIQIKKRRKKLSVGTEVLE